MESIFVIKKSKLVKIKSKMDSQKSKLLPGYFKIIGLSLMILAFTPEVIIVISKVSILEPQKGLLKSITKTLFILGLLFIALARDKVEDEMTFALRLNVMAGVFLFAVFFVIIKPFVDIWLSGSLDIVTGTHIVVLMLIFYLIMYNFLKLRR